MKTKKISITVFLLLAGICFNREVFAETLYQDDFSAGASGWKAHDSASESGIVEEIKKWFQKQK